MRSLEGLYDAFNEHDVERLRQLYAEDAKLLGPGGELNGREAAVAFSAEWYRAFPDTRCELVSEVVSDDRFCFEFTRTSSPVRLGTASGRSVRCGSLHWR
jgi:ketosteroid isomerase-like protein